MEQGAWEPTETGTPQVSLISPILANLNQHYALDLWFEIAVKRACRGEASMIRYANDCAPSNAEQKDEGGLLGAAVQAEASTPVKLLRLKAVGGER